MSERARPPGSPRRLVRTTFRANRALDFSSEKELTAQIGHQPAAWPLVALKELLDNSIDAAEDAGNAPEIEVRVDREGIIVGDNGAGIPPDTIAGMVDFSVRVSSKAAYVSPTRGAQGIALKTILAMPLALGAEEGRVEISACGIRHEILCRVDRVHQEMPVSLKEHPAPDVKNGTVVRLHWPPSASSLLQEAREQFLQITRAFTFLNPHLTLTLDWFGEGLLVEATDPTWAKWRPSDPTCAHWYRVEDLARLVAAYIKHDADRGDDRTVRELVAEFRGLTGTAKQRAVLEATGLARMPLSALVDGQDLDRGHIHQLLAAMQAHSKPVRPAALGMIGRDHLQRRFAWLGGEMETFAYDKKAGESDGVPWIVEAAFAWLPSVSGRRLMSGVNWSPGILVPFRHLGRSGSLDYVLAEQRADPLAPVVLVVHVAHPRPGYADRGKSAVHVTDEPLSQALADAVRAVTKKWAKARKAQERQARASLRERLVRPRRESITAVAGEVMPAAYLQASGDGRYPARPRQVYYVARPTILERTGRESLDGQYFSQKLLTGYMQEHPDATRGWKIAWDARGHFAEPHTGRVVPQGTEEVRQYLAAIDRHQVGPPRFALAGETPYPTCGPRHRFQAILFIEKEGFEPLFAAVRLQERYDLAILSNKGQSVTASRQLAETLGIPLLVLHDFDKAGFSIRGVLQRDTPRYQFTTPLRVIDLGLRLADVRAHTLQAEPVTYDNREGDPRPNLRKNKATEEEVAVLCSSVTRDSHGKPVYSGRRVELNAFTSDRLISWIEGKLRKHGIKKVIPDEKTLKAAFRRSREVQLRLAHDEIFTEEARRRALGAKVPKDLARRVGQRLRADPTLSWDQAVAELAAKAGGRKAPGDPGIPRPPHPRAPRTGRRGAEGEEGAHPA